jgi:hypothetical protein
VPEEELAALRKAGYFLDLWHWRAHRSNPIDVSDDEYVFEVRGGDAGRGPFTDNWDPEKSQPRFMLDPEKIGRRALRWEDLIQHKLGFNDTYFISEAIAKPFDASHQWQEGDTIPRRLLRPGDGSHGDIKVAGKARWRDGYWDVALVRAMDTGHPIDDKILVDKHVYNLAFAVHRDATGSRWHYVSLPVTLGLGRDADLVAARFEGDTPQWQQAWLDVVLFYPGQVSWPHLNSAKHAGASKIKEGVPVRSRHSEIQLAHYGVEGESAETIRWQWLLSMAAGVLLIIGFGVALNGLSVRKGAHTSRHQKARPLQQRRSSHYGPPRRPLQLSERRLGVRPRRNRRPFPHRAGRHLSGPDEAERHSLPPRHRRLLQKPRHHRRARHDRQRVVLPLQGLPPRLHAAPPQAHLHQAVYAADQWQSRALHPDRAPRMGLRHSLRPLRPAPPSAPALASSLQLAQATC